MKIPKAKRLPSGNYCIELRLGGERYSVTRRTEKECKQAAQMLKADHLAGKKVEIGKPKAPEKITLDAAIDRFIAKRDNVLSPSTVAGYKAIKRTRFKDYMETALSDMDADDWQIACNKEAKLCSAKTLKNAWGFVASVIQDVTGERAPRVKLPQVVVRDMPFLEPEQIEPFIKAVHGKSMEIPALLGLSSLRRSEILALKWENVDLKNDIIHVRGAAVRGENNKLVQKEANKNASSARPVPIMIPELHQALEAVEDKTGYVVHCNANNMWSAISTICEKNELPLIGVHGLRRSFVSLGFHLGIPEEYIMEIGGWSDYQTMRKHYKRLAQSDRKKYADAMLQFFGGSIKNADENADETKNAAK